MASNINTSNIDANFPVQGQDNPSQGFRDNFSYINIALDTAASEITALQENSVEISTATSTSTGVVKIGSGIAITGDGTISVPYILPSYTTSTVHSISPALAGALVFVSNAPGGGQPCYYDGSHWYTINGRTQI